MKIFGCPLFLILANFSLALSFLHSSSIFPSSPVKMLRKTRFLYGMRHNTRFMSSAVPRIMPSHSYAPITSDVTEHRDTHDDLITQVLTKSDAKRVLNVLYKYPNAYWACDTETTGLDIKSQGPVGNGAVTCISIYGGPDIDFGDGPGSALWIENIDKSAGLIQEFKQWFEDEKYKKVWHNYGFDRHVMFNEGVDCKGFGGEKPVLPIHRNTSQLYLT